MSGFPPVTATTGDPVELAATGQSALVVPAHAGDHPDPPDRRPAVRCARCPRANRTWATSRCRWPTDASTVAKVLDTTYTDGLLVLHDGRRGHRALLRGDDGVDPPLVMSVSKSIVGCVAGSWSRGDNSIPDAAGHAPTSPRSPVPAMTARRVRRCARHAHRRGVQRGVHAPTTPRSGSWSARWAGRPAGPTIPCGAYAYLTTLGTEGPHGAGFVYRSATPTCSAGCASVPPAADGRPDSDAHLAADGRGVRRRHHLRLRRDRRPRRWDPRHAAGSGPVRPAAARRRQVRGTPGGSRPPGWPTPTHRRPMCEQRLPAPTTSRCCPAAGTAISSGSSPGVRDRPAVPGHPRPAGVRRPRPPGRWWSSSPRGRTRRTPTIWRRPYGRAWRSPRRWRPCVRADAQAPGWRRRR